MSFWKRMFSKTPGARMIERERFVDGLQLDAVIRQRDQVSEGAAQHQKTLAPVKYFAEQNHIGPLLERYLRGIHAPGQQN